MPRWFRWRAGSPPARVRGSGASEDLAHLTEFARTRRGVEGFVEPRTTVTETTLLLVADDGEWTRRRVPDAARAHEFANRLGIPSYDAQVVGYPQRMRAWNSRRAAAEKQAKSLGPTAPGEAG
ncbi:hypothetical protein [Actinopolymorpha rutila]|uniref:Uncharacterized protein n=1 Tax=Actinopolymorpha rutila TaxID=446787 RepID=A0A852ZD43_9ACTN|nr:hypothetical protein [Actinopolymorpha rutila]NYH89692.1 hypothetical protein [Actinopolymorpha rutila]